MATGGAMAAAGGATSSTGGQAATGGASAFGGKTAGADGGVSPYGGSTRPAPDASVPCAVSIAPADRPDFLSLLPGDTSNLTVKGTIAWGSSAPTLPDWQWTVRGPDGTPLAITSIPTTDQTTSIAKFPLLVPGWYSISVSVSSSCTNSVWAYAAKPQEVSQAYFIRILPPPAGSADSSQTCNTSGPSRWCPSQDAVPSDEPRFMLQAGQARQYNVSLMPGHAVSIDPVAVAQPDPKAFPPVAVPSYVRVSLRGSSWTFDGASSSNQPLRALLDPNLTYDILVVPQPDPATKIFPPFLVSKGAQAFQPSDFDVAAGVTLKGTLSGPSGPAAGARLLLRVDANSPVTLPLPSTVGSADATGSYSLRASAGALFSAVVMPPPGTSLPQVTITNGIDLQATANGAILDHIDFTWNAISTTTLTLAVLLSDNSAPAANVTVRLQSQDGALPDAGVLTLASAPAGAAWGSVRREGTTDANGSIVFPDIPKIAYQLTLIPPSDLAGAAIFSGSIDLSLAAASITRALNLGHKVTLSGHLYPADATGGARLVATDTGTDVLASTISTLVDSDGSYRFQADPGRTYRFSVEPAAGKKLPSRVPLYGVATTDQDTPPQDRTVPAGLRVSGIVSFNGPPVAGAIVQAYCTELGIADCLNPGSSGENLPPPLVEVATQPDGSYELYLLDPGGGVPLL